MVVFLLLRFVYNVDMHPFIVNVSIIHEQIKKIEKYCEHDGIERSSLKLSIHKGRTVSQQTCFALL